MSNILPAIRDDLCRAILFARDEVYRLQIAAMMPGLTPGQIKIIKRQERVARERRRALCGMLRAEVRSKHPTQLSLPLPPPEG